MVEVNQVYTHDFSFSQKEVNQFAEVTGDKNPVHTRCGLCGNNPIKTPNNAWHVKCKFI